MRVIRRPNCQTLHSNKKGSFRFRMLPLKLLSGYAVPYPGMAGHWRRTPTRVMRVTITAKSFHSLSKRKNCINRVLPGCAEAGRNVPKRYMQRANDKYICPAKKNGFRGSHSAGLCYKPRHTLNAGWSSPVARQAHNLKVVSSNLAPATKLKPAISTRWRVFVCVGAHCRKQLQLVPAPHPCASHIKRGC